MLKYEHITTGAKIRAWDFPKSPDRIDRYVEGTVQRQEWIQGAKVLVITGTKDVVFPEGGNRVGLEVYVPMEIMFEDEEYDLRPRVEIID